MITRQTADVIELSNGIAIEVATASFRTIRGFSLIAALFDEASFWRSEDSANPDAEILTAVKPSLATTGGLLLVASSPYAKRGILWQAFSKYFGQPGPKLVWKAPTLRMNPCVPREVIEEAYAADEVAARAEYGAEFRQDIDSYVSAEVLDACIARGRHELLPTPGIRYFAFADPSGGSSDSYTLAISHKEQDKIILDCIRETRPPFSAEAVTDAYSALLKNYKTTTVHGDKYAGIFPRELFQKRSITYKVCDLSKSDIYREMIPALNAHRVELLDHPRMRSQFLTLERKTGRGTGRDVTDHAPNSKDDVVNSVCGALWAAGATRGPMVFSDYFMQRAKEKPWPPPIGSAHRGLIASRGGSF
jgi:hypothetical protein